MSVNMSTAVTRSPSAPAVFPARRERRLGTRGFEHHRSPRAQIHPPGNFPTLALGQHGVERCITVRHCRSRRKTAGLQGFIVRDQQITDGVHAVARQKGRIFSRRIDDIVVKQKNPVFDPGDDRLKQYRVVVSGSLIEISNKRYFIVNGLGKIASRSLQGFDECRCTQFSEIFQRVFALMTRRAMGAVPVMQEEIFAAQRRNSGAFKNLIGEIFVRCQR